MAIFFEAIDQGDGRLETTAEIAAVVEGVPRDWDASRGASRVRLVVAGVFRVCIAAVGGAAAELRARFSVGALERPKTQIVPLKLFRGNLLFSTGGLCDIDQDKMLCTTMIRAWGHALRAVHGPLWQVVGVPSRFGFGHALDVPVGPEFLLA